METLRYIHAADLHLDAPLAVSIREGDPRDAHLADATFSALERLIQCCESERPDFLVLAGDLYNQEDYSVKAQMALRDGCARLRQLDIPVLIAHGNRDPLPSRLQTLTWPDNVTTFGSHVERKPILKDGQPIALVHGISHKRHDERRNLATLFSRDRKFDGFQLGVLHCFVNGQSANGHFAPCALDDLKKTGLDAWALGHVHDNIELCDIPYVAYCGNSQGLSINEHGERGCTLVTATRTNDNTYACSGMFLPLGRVLWQSIILDVQFDKSLEDIIRGLSSQLAAICKGLDAECLNVIVSVTLIGRTNLDTTLRQPEIQYWIQEKAANICNDDRLILKAVQISTLPFSETTELRTRKDLLGTALQYAHAAVANPKDRIDLLKALQRSNTPPLNALPEPDEEHVTALLGEAERLCLNLLEASHVH
jgi:DNA repair exonuclease SbcCD nuclease subunit